MRLNTIFDVNRKKKSKRVGRGIGSGKGKTSGSGHKGQKARTGVAINAFEGGQMPLTRRLPKRGFNNPKKVINKVINLDQIEKSIKAGQLKAGKITKQELKNAGLISKLGHQVKLLAKGKLTQKISINVDLYSEQAVKAIKDLGGTISTNDDVEQQVEVTKKTKKSK